MASSAQSLPETTSGRDLEKGVVPCAESKPPASSYNGFDRAVSRIGVYQQLFFLALTANVIAALALFSIGSSTYLQHLENTANATAANLAIAIFIRQEYVVNFLFAACWSVPHTAPLSLRRQLAKIYEFGGIHSGAATCALLWFMVFSGYLTKCFIDGQLRNPVLLGLDYALLLLLLALTISSLPAIRTRHHNVFERLHRFAGWTTLGLFWSLIFVFLIATSAQKEQDLGLVLAATPAFWFATASTIFTVLPWLRLRKVSVEVEQLSSHAVRLHLSERIPIFKGVAISDSPLSQWHSFASFPDDDGAKSSILISNAGDWTKKTIMSPKKHYYLRGFPRTGVLAMAQLFRSVVVVTTGSGIGPTLAIAMGLVNTQCRLIWSTPEPLKTYGVEISKAVRKADKDAVIVDTRAKGRPDLVKLAYGMYMASAAEAVFIISNQRVTRSLISALRERDVPAFAPIFDS